MITQSENAAAVAEHSGLAQAVAEYKQLLADNSLPLSVDMEVLTTAYRSQLFQKLLAVDKGLKLRWDMLRTDDARLRLITDTIDLTGYDVIDELAERVKGLETAYNRVYIRTGNYGVGRISQTASFTQFANVYGLDFSAMLDAHTYDWAGKEHVLAYVAQLAPLVQQLRNVLRVTHGTHYDKANTLRVLADFYRESEAGEVLPNEHATMGLARRLDKAGRLDMIPTV